MRLDTLAEPFTAPISDDAPGGIEAKYEDAYEAVRGEVGKLDSPTGGAVDWPGVEKGCAALLKTTSKDFLIAAYLAGAMWEQRRFEGLAEGVAILAGILDDFWDEGFPKKKRIRARVNAVSWLVNRTESVADAQVTAADRDSVMLLEEAVKRLVSVVGSRFEDQAPPVRPLRDNVKRVILSLPEPEPEPAPVQPVQPAPTAAPAPVAPKPAPAAAPKAAAQVVSAAMPDAASFAASADVKKFLQQVGESLYKAARELKKANPGAPQAYRLARLGLYLHLEGPPPAEGGQKTTIPPPPQPLVQQLEALASGQNWAPLLEEAEGALKARRFWLDLHRYVALALGGLGHAEARDAVLIEVASLLRRLPGVQQRQFSDGLPFASPATVEWFETEVNPATEGGSGGGGGDGLSDEERAGFDEAKKLVASGKVTEAVEALTVIDRSASTAAVRFRARLAVAKACAARGSHATADGVFAALQGEIDDFQLERWDPDLVAGCYAAHYEVLKVLIRSKTGEGKQVDPSLTERLTGVYARLCRVAPSIALSAGA